MLNQAGGFTGWLNRRREKEAVEQLLIDYAEVGEQAAEVAATRLALKSDYGSIVEEAAEMAVQRREIKEERQIVIEQVAAVFADRTTVKQTTYHLLKGNIGPGCLSLPWAFSQLGIPVACVATFLVAGWTYYNCVSLLHSKRLHTSDRRTFTYSDMGEIAYGKHFRSFITGSIVSLQMAICTVFLSFVADNTKSFYAGYFPGKTLLGTSTALNVFMVVPIAASLTLLPNLKALGPVSELAMFILFSGFALLGVVLFLNVDTRPAELPTIDWVKAPLAVSAILYSFEGICIVLPLEATMKDRSKFLNIFTYSYFALAFIYCTMGAVCVWILGEITNGSITAFLLDNADKYEGQLLVSITNLLVSLAVILTYALTIFPCIELFCQDMERKARGDDTLEPGEEEDDWWGGSLAYGPFDTPALRLSLVAITVFAAVVVPNVRQLIALAGAISGASTALILPPLLALKFEQSESETDKVTGSIIVNYISLVLGIVFGLFGTGAAVYDIVKTFE